VVQDTNKTIYSKQSQDVPFLSFYQDKDKNDQGMAGWLRLVQNRWPGFCLFFHRCLFITTSSFTITFSFPSHCSSTTVKETKVASCLDSASSHCLCHSPFTKMSIYTFRLEPWAFLAFNP
jgi:hypothetical protein